MKPVSALDSQNTWIYLREIDIDRMEKDVPDYSASKCNTY
jgi:hypothetical protein